MLGEESGNLDNCLQSLALYYEKEENIAKSIRNAISYPLLMIIMMFIVIYILVSKVLPIFSQVFSDLGSEMTGFAATLSSLGSSLSRYSSIILVVLCLIILLYLICTKVPKFKKITSNFFSVFPLTRGFYQKLACQRFASGMALN